MTIYQDAINNKYCRIAEQFHSKISKKVDRFDIAKNLWDLAWYLKSVDDGKKHEQHLVMLASKWVKELPDERV